MQSRENLSDKKVSRVFLARSAAVLSVYWGTGCVQVNSPLFPGPVNPLVIDRACPQVMGQAGPFEAPPTASPQTVSVPRLTPPVPTEAIPMEPVP